MVNTFSNINKANNDYKKPRHMALNSLKTPTCYSEAVNRRRAENTMTQRKKTNGHTMM